MCLGLETIPLKIQLKLHFDHHIPIDINNAFWVFHTMGQYQMCSSCFCYLHSLFPKSQKEKVIQVPCEVCTQLEEKGRIHSDVCFVVFSFLKVDSSAKKDEGCVSGRQKCIVLTSGCKLYNMD